MLFTGLLAGEGAIRGIQVTMMANRTVRETRIKTNDWRYQYGPHAWWDWLILASMLKAVGDAPKNTYYPVLRMLADDPLVLDQEYQALRLSLSQPRWYDSPRKKWQLHYGNFVRELEFVLTGLKPKLSEEDFHNLVVNTVADRLDDWAGFIKPMMDRAAGIIPKPLMRGAPDGESGLKALYQSDYKDRFTWVVQLATFLVGPMKAEVESGGVLKVEIPRCAMHTVVSDTDAQVFSCLYACKAACEKFLDADAAMQLQFEPNIPEQNCTLRVFFKG